MFLAQGMVASGLDSPHLLEQIKSLKSTVGWLKEENQIHKSKQMKVCISDFFEDLSLTLHSMMEDK